MIDKIVNISSFTIEALQALIEIIERLGWCFDWGEEATIIINVPMEDELIFDFLMEGF